MKSPYQYQERYLYPNLYRNLNRYLYLYLYLYPVERTPRVKCLCLEPTSILSIYISLEEFIVKVSTRRSGYLLCVSL